MAKIWPVYEGKEPTSGDAWADLPLREAVALLELSPQDFLSDSGETQRLGNAGRDLSFLGFRHVVLEVGSVEGRREGWKPGFYLSRLKPADAFARLLRQTFEAVLGRKNVLRVEYEPAVDSQGEDAIGVTVVVASDAIERLKDGTALKALILLQRRLREMREYRTPIVQYATEAELMQDAGT